MPSFPKPVSSFWTFTCWLISQQDRHDTIGQFARAVAADPTWPGGQSIQGLAAYFRGHRAPQKRLDALHRAWAEWEATRKEV